ncbi:semaphorin-7A-like, partial [Tachysurus ichikawai]
NCKYEISMLKEGRNGNPLFLCGTREHHTNCCDVERLGLSSLEHKLVNCSRLNYPTKINEPSVHVDDSLYYTISDVDTAVPSGLYRQTRDKYIWPQSREIEQRHVKILANKGNGLLDGKVYSFYIEKNQNQNFDLPQWIPRVSQICMADLGGSKAMLQFRWTSMLTARLFCGDEKKRLSYTELLDVAVLEATEWENTMIYALFKNT